MDRVTELVGTLPIDLPSRKITPTEVHPAIEMISGVGVFKGEDIENFMKLHDCGLSYAVVAIMGPQSSGKSTVLNCLFHTKFPMKESRSSERWNRKTRGIWISEAPNMDQLTMVMDVEGTDGQERAKDVAFEKQTTLFSLVVADILIINMWHKDIGLMKAANWPLLETIFVEMLKIFKSRPRKATLQFVIRDNETDQTEIGDLKTKLSDDVQKIWERVLKIDDFKNTPLTKFFNVEVDALPHYKFETTHFNEEVVKLREKIQGSLRLAGDRSGVVPTSGFSLNAEKLWEDIRLNKNLDLPSHNEMVATLLCENIAMEKLRLFQSDKEWLKVKEAAKKGLVTGFNAKISSILSRYLSVYDADSKYFEESVRNSSRQNLEKKAYEVVHPAFINTLGHLRTDVLREFETKLEQLLSEGGGYAESKCLCRESCESDFDSKCSDIVAIEEAKWDASFVRKELVRDMENHALHVRTHKLPQLVEQHRALLGNKVTRRLNDIFGKCDKEGISWPDIISLLKRQCDDAASDFRSTVAAFELDKETLVQNINDLKQSARKLVVDKFKEENASVLDRMKESFVLSLYKKEEPFPKCLKLLLNMAAIRLDESSKDDKVESLLLSILIDGGDDVSGDGDGGDPLASNAWGEITPEMTLITPAQCRDICVQFKQDIVCVTSQIQSVENECPSYFEQLPGCDSETSECDSETSEIPPPPQQNESRREIPYWMRVGTWLLGWTKFVSLLCRYDYASALAASFELAVEVTELVGDCPQEIKETVKNGCKRMSGKYHRMMKKLEELLKRYYNFMEAKFKTKSEVKVSSEMAIF